MIPQSPNSPGCRRPPWESSGSQRGRRHGPTSQSLLNEDLDISPRPCHPPCCHLVQTQLHCTWFTSKLSMNQNKNSPQGMARAENSIFVTVFPRGKHTRHVVRSLQVYSALILGILGANYLGRYAIRNS